MSCGIYYQHQRRCWVFTPAGDEWATTEALLAASDAMLGAVTHAHGAFSFPPLPLRIQAVPPAVLRDCGALRTLSLHDNPITVEELRNTEGWAAHDARRRQKHDKQLGSEVLGPGMDEGADAHPVQNWK